MRYLQQERDALERHMPGLLDALAAHSFQELEAPGGPALQLLRDAGGAAMLIPTELGGMGLGPVESLRIHRALGAAAPSASIGATMHNFSVATLVALNAFGDDEFQTQLLRSMAEHKLYMASGFAEGRPGTSIMSATLRARRGEHGGYLLTGAKQPCTLSHSLDLLSASVTIDLPEGPRRGIALVPSDAEGLSVEPFWRSIALRGAESERVVLKDVFIPDDLMWVPDNDDTFDPVETLGYVWFQLLISASYLGICSRLPELCVERHRGGPVPRVELISDLEAAASALEGVAAAMLLPDFDAGALLPRMMFVRYSLQSTIMRVASRSAELLGGMAFIMDDEVPQRLAATRCLALHPPSLGANASALEMSLRGESLPIV